MAKGGEQMGSPQGGSEEEKDASAWGGLRLH